MADFFETGLAAYEELKRVPVSTLRSVIRAPGKIQKLFR
jgi:hypothetical protein